MPALSCPTRAAALEITAVTLSCPVTLCNSEQPRGGFGVPLTLTIHGVGFDRMKAGGEAEDAQTQAQVAGETQPKKRHEKRLAVSFEEAVAIEVLLPGLLFKIRSSCLGMPSATGSA